MFTLKDLIRKKIIKSNYKKSKLANSDYFRLIKNHNLYKRARQLVHSNYYKWINEYFYQIKINALIYIVEEERRTIK